VRSSTTVHSTCNMVSTGISFSYEKTRKIGLLAAGTSRISMIYLAVWTEYQSATDGMTDNNGI